MPADTVRRRRPDAGFSAVEVVIAAPLLMLFILVLVGLGQISQAQSTLDGTARDAARAGALQRDWSSAVAAARDTANANIGGTCAGGVTVTPSGNFVPGGMFTITLSCDVPGLRSLGIGWTRQVSGTSTAPLDTYRRVAP
ncbi:TadE/TadG family type IV pilus assembly protein [Kitasatospora sp. NPDC058965]|uniref:TadE/TadG family type IV pilus assembly protein n=1 Tax=Kitasatospora sp. NPDC058965 TaxID=3346682 RepID=UPI00368BFD37